MSKLRIIPLGGLGEVGKNMTVVEYDGAMVLVDAGVRFPTAEQHGVDLVLPDFTYVRERAERLRAVVLTHGHEDHIGALPWLYRELAPADRAPVIARRLTAAMAQSKLDEHKLRDVVVRRLEPGEEIAVGPLRVELVHMTHSIPDAAAVALTCALGTVLFTGDYRFDHTSPYATAAPSPPTASCSSSSPSPPKPSTPSATPKSSSAASHSPPTKTN
jgi:ribonuclease J